MDWEDLLENMDLGGICMLLSLLAMLVGAALVQKFGRRFLKTVEQLGRTVGSSGLSGRAVARRLLDQCGLPDVGVVPATFRDCYDAKHREIRLAAENFQGASISAVAVAAHEVGHAQQHAAGTLAWRAAPLVGRTCWILLVAACLLLLLGVFVTPWTAIHVAVVAICVASLTLQTAVVLPREVDASRRARELALQSDLLPTPLEVEQFNQVLRSAAWTYVAGMSYRWLGLIGVALAILVIGNAPELREEAVFDEDGLLADRQAVAEVVAPESLVDIQPTTATIADGPLSSAPAPATPLGGLRPGFDVPPPAMYGPAPGMGYTLLMTVISVLEWCGVLGLVAVFLVLGRWQRKWTAPQRAEKRNQAGVQAFARENYEAALREFTQAIQLDRDLTSCHHNRATVYRQLDRLDEALSDYENALRLHPGLVDALFGRAEIWWQRGDRQRALDDLHEVLRLAPECTAALHLRGRLFLDAEQADAALADFERARALDANDPLPWWGRGMVGMLRDDYQSAIEDFSAALTRAPQFFAALRDRGLAKHFLGDDQGAIADLNEAIHFDPTDALAWNNVGAAWQQLGRYAQAEADLREATRLNANFL